MFSWEKTTTKGVNAGSGCRGADEYTCSLVSPPYLTWGMHWSTITPAAPLTSCPFHRTLSTDGCSSSSPRKEQNPMMSGTLSPSRICVFVFFFFFFFFFFFVRRLKFSLNSWHLMPRQQAYKLLFSKRKPGRGKKSFRPTYTRPSPGFLFSVNNRCSTGCYTRKAARIIVCHWADAAAGVLLLVIQLKFANGVGNFCSSFVVSVTFYHDPSPTCSGCSWENAGDNSNFARICSKRMFIWWSSSNSPQHASIDRVLTQRH